MYDNCSRSCSSESRDQKFSFYFSKDYNPQAVASMESSVVRLLYLLSVG